MSQLQEHGCGKFSLPLKWHGGKHYLAKKIVDLMPPHTHYVEPFFGGGAVLFAKNPDGVSEVVNDLNKELSCFWSVIKVPEFFERFKRQIECTPFSQNEWRMTQKPWSGNPQCDPVLVAAMFFVKYRQSRQGLGKDFATLSRTRTRRGMNEQVSSWLSAIEGLPDAHARLKRVVILNDDAVKVIKQQDGPQTLFYCDPPYLHETRTATSAYEFEMSEEDHTRLLACLQNVEGTVLLSGYNSELYNDMLTGWEKFEIQIPNHSSGSKTKEIKTECVWRKKSDSDIWGNQIGSTKDLPDAS